MNTIKDDIPHGSVTTTVLPADFSECITLTGCPSPLPSADQLQLSFWTDMPGWVSFLFRVRNNLVKLVGLQSPKGDLADNLRRAIYEDARTEFLYVLGQSENEIAICLNDKHLTAYLSTIVNQELRTVSLITIVKFNNRLGKVYFRLIYPFHYVIVRSMLKRAVRRTGVR